MSRLAAMMPKRAGARWLAGLMMSLTIGLAPPAAAQSLAARVRAAGDGKVALSFAARPGVCGNGHDVRFAPADDERYWESSCERGPVRVILTVAEGRVTDVDTYVGGHLREAPELRRLGTVSAPAAAEFLLDLVASGSRTAARAALVPAGLADSVTVWPRLLQVARDHSRDRDVRRAVIFWLGQMAGARLTAALADIAGDSGDDRQVQRSAVFALSRLPDGQGIPRLIAIARGHHDPAIRREAVFWLGRSDDPRALALFEEILAGR